MTFDFINAIALVNFIISFLFLFRAIQTMKGTSQVQEEARRILNECYQMGEDKHDG